MEPISQEERTIFNELYERELSDAEIHEIIRNLVGYFKLLIETDKEHGVKNGNQ